MDLLAAQTAPTASFSHPLPPSPQTSNSHTAALEGAIFNNSNAATRDFLSVLLVGLLGWFGSRSCSDQVATAIPCRLHCSLARWIHQNREAQTHWVKTSKQRSGGSGGGAKRWHGSSTGERCLAAPAESRHPAGTTRKGKTRKVFMRRKVYFWHTHKHCWSNTETSSDNMLELSVLNEVKSVFTEDRPMLYWLNVEPFYRK